MQPEIRKTMKETDITRLSQHDLNDFQQIYQAEQQPIVITDLFADKTISKLDSIDKVKDILGTESVVMRRNYIDAAKKSIINYFQGKKAALPGEARKIDFNDFFEISSKEPDKNWIITGSPTPESIIDDLDLGALGVEKIASGYREPRYAVPEKGEPVTARSLMFFANAGNASDLHTDWDGLDVVLYQASGIKRVTLFPPEAAMYLMPINIFSTVKLNGMPEKERQGLVESLGGYDFLLHPGEAVYMPAFFWHHLEYVEQGLSFSFRFGGTADPDVLFLLDFCHRDVYTQNLLAKFVKDSQSESHRQAIIKLCEAYHRPYSTPKAKYRELTALSRKLYHQICHQSPKFYTWISYTDFLDGLLLLTYLRPDPKWNRFKKATWIYREKLRSYIRKMVFRLAHWI